MTPKQLKITPELLNAELDKNLKEMEEIHLQISSQASKYSVNELYGRLNHLTVRNREIESQVFSITTTYNGKDDKQLEKAIALASASCVAIRPSHALLNQEAGATSGNDDNQSEGQVIIAGGNSSSESGKPETGILKKQKYAAAN